MNNDLTSLKKKIRNTQLLVKVENFNTNQQLDSLIEKQKFAQNKKQDLDKTLTEIEQFKQAYITEKDNIDFYPELHTAVSSYFGKLTTEKTTKQQELTDTEETVFIQSLAVAKCRKKESTLQNNISILQKEQLFFISKMEDQQLTELSNQRKISNIENIINA